MENVVKNTAAAIVQSMLTALSVRVTVMTAETDMMEERALSEMRKGQIMQSRDIRIAAVNRSIADLEAELLNDGITPAQQKELADSLRDREVELATIRREAADELGAEELDLVRSVRKITRRMQSEIMRAEADARSYLEAVSRIPYPCGGEEDPDAGGLIDDVPFLGVDHGTGKEE